MAHSDQLRSRIVEGGVGIEEYLQREERVSSSDKDNVIVDEPMDLKRE